jgi:hypothetical protein
MLVLARLGYEKRILSFVTATTIVEDVFAIACSNILLGVIFSGGKWPTHGVSCFHDGDFELL